MLRLVDCNWSKELVEGVQADSTGLRIMAPFIKAGALRRLLEKRPKSVRVITRFNLNDFADRVSDLDALSALLAAGAEVRGVKGLHSKLYVFGASRAVVTSANLTAAALDRNEEFGVTLYGTGEIQTCAAYFDRMWSRAGVNLTRTKVTEWACLIEAHRKNEGWGPGKLALGDFGSDIDGTESSKTSAAGAPVTIPNRLPAYVKLLGEATNRSPLSLSVLDEVERSGCNLTLAFPRGKRPGAPEGSLMFISRMVTQSGQGDIRVFGFATAHAHEVESDDASSLDIERRPWRRIWPHYVRVYDAHFLAGTLADGVSLNELMDELRADSFAPTQRNKELNRTSPISPPRNENPRKSYSQQPSVELTREGQAWLSARLLAAFRRVGEIPGSDLAGIA